MEDESPIDFPCQIKTNNYTPYPLDQFTDKQFKILSLYFNEKRNYQYISSVLKTSKSTISSTLKKAVKIAPKLKKTV